MPKRGRPEIGVCEAEGHEGCVCFGRLALRLGLIGSEDLRRALLRPGGIPLETTLVRRGQLSPAMAARVNEVLTALGPCRSRGARARTG